MRCGVWKLWPRLWSGSQALDPTFTEPYPGSPATSRIEKGKEENPAWKSLPSVASQLGWNQILHQGGNEDTGVRNWKWSWDWQENRWSMKRSSLFNAFIHEDIKNTTSERAHISVCRRNSGTKSRGGRWQWHHYGATRGPWGFPLFLSNASSGEQPTSMYWAPSVYLALE